MPVLPLAVFFFDEGNDHLRQNSPDWFTWAKFIVHPVNQVCSGSVAMTAVGGYLFMPFFFFFSL